MRGKPSYPRRRWTEEEIQRLRQMYPDHRAEDIAKAFGKSPAAIWGMAQSLGLRKSIDYLESPKSGRMLRGGTKGKDTRFRPGHSSWNKGTRFVAGGRSAETRFAPGQAPHNTREIGSYRIRSDGYLEMKYSNEAGGPSARWRTVHRMVWEREHGPTPAGCIVVFRPGTFTTELHKITLDRLELVTRQELMKRNTIHKLPEELVSVIRLRGSVTRQINKRTRQA